MTMLRIYTHPAFLRHDTGPNHPERAERLQILLDLFDEPAFDSVPIVRSRAAEWEEIARAHDEAYMTRLEELMPEGHLALIDSDTVTSPGTWNAALHAAGAVCQAVDEIMAGECRRAFCAVRPPGHHAFPDHAEGFCLFNNVFIGALHAQAAHGIERVAILDFDVHHGNGSDAMARRHEGIFYASTHQWPLYPGSGLPEENVPGRIINVPLPARSGSHEFRRAWSESILPKLEIFSPGLVMISAGFDAHRDDPLAQLDLTEDDFGWITQELVTIAGKHCEGRIVSVLEGGYDLQALKKSVAAHLRTLTP